MLQSCALRYWTCHLYLHCTSSSNSTSERSSIISFGISEENDCCFTPLASWLPVSMFQTTFSQLLTGYFLTPRFGPARKRFVIVVKRRYSTRNTLWRYSGTVVNFFFPCIWFTPNNSRKECNGTIGGKQLVRQPLGSCTHVKNLCHTGIQCVSSDILTKYVSHYII